MIDLKFHPLCELFPRMEGPAFAELIADIKTNGLRTPLAMYEGRILDGRNRYLACKAAGVVPDVVDVVPKDPVAYVLAANLYRRHLTVGQRAMIAAKVKEQYKEIARKSGGKTRDAAGNAVHVSGKSVDHASDVLKGGVPELVKAVEAGKIAVSAAAAIAGLPAAEQQATIREYTAEKDAKETGKASGKPAKAKKARKGTSSKGPHESRVLRGMKVLWLRADNTERADFLLWTKTNTK